MIVCIPVTVDGRTGPSWGKAQRIAFATVSHGRLTGWDEVDVAWDVAHGVGTEGSHHARVARTLLDREVGAVVADHMGPGMVRMLATMKIDVMLGAAGDARAAVLSAVAHRD